MSNFTVFHYSKCTRPAVDYSTHIERKKSDGTEHRPYNVTRPEMTSLNKEFIERAQEIGRTAAIEERIDVVRHQIDGKGQAYERKIRKDQVKCIEIICSASPEAMARIVEYGRLDDWARDSISWAMDEHGKENIVSAVLHLDEKTPHLHITMVPIVKGKSKKQAGTEKRKVKGEEPPRKKRRYKKKADENTLRLCADDVMTQSALFRRQTTYAEAMASYGLQRGRVNSGAVHKGLADHYAQETERNSQKLDDVLAELKRKNDALALCEKKLDRAATDLIKKRNELAEKTKKVEGMIAYGEKAEELLDEVKGTLSTLDKDLEKRQEEFDRYGDAISFIEERISENKEIENDLDRREERLSEIERAALETIANAPIRLMSGGKIKVLSQEIAQLKIELERLKTKLANTEKEARLSSKELVGVKKDFADYKKQIDDAYSALERRHPDELRLLKELVSIGITTPQYQDIILSGKPLDFDPCRWKDPKNGKRIPEEYKETVRIKVEGSGKDSYISMCGKRIADFFRDIWARVTAALNCKTKQEIKAAPKTPHIVSPKKGIKM